MSVAVAEVQKVLARVAAGTCFAVAVEIAVAVATAVLASVAASLASVVEAVGTEVGTGSVVTAGTVWLLQIWVRRQVLLQLDWFSLLRC